MNDKGHPIYIRMTVVEGFRSQPIGQWAQRLLASGGVVLTVGLACFKATKEAGCEHLGFVVGGKLELLDHKVFNWVNTMISNVKSSLRGSCHLIAAKNLPRHLTEYCYRFNNRFNLRALLPKPGRHAVRTPPMPYGLLKMAEVFG